MQRICTSLVAVRAGSVMCALAGLLRMTSAGCSRAMTSSRSQERPRVRELHGSGGLWDSEKPTISDSEKPGLHTEVIRLGRFGTLLIKFFSLAAQTTSLEGPKATLAAQVGVACVHMRTQSESVRSMSDISVMGIILIIHAQSIPHLTQTKQDISSSHSSRQL